MSVKQIISKLGQFNKVSITGKNGISAKIIADSVNKSGSRLTTYELEYPRFVHSEFMTHRTISKNSASSRAIPVTKMIDNIKSSTAVPIHWGKNQKGMQAQQEHDELIKHNDELISKDKAWIRARDSAVDWAEKFDKAGYHKQIVNRLIEPFKMMKVVCSATEYDNYFWLRCHKDAQPEIKELADIMHNARTKSNPVNIDDGEYHLPYITPEIMKNCVEYAVKTNQDPLKVALKVSSSCCAQVSYRLNDTSVEKAIKIYDQLVTSEPVHASPFEHQARPVTEDDFVQFRVSQIMNNLISDDCVNITTDKHTSPITHICSRGYCWSGNFREWVQHRHEIPNNTVSKYAK